MGQSWDVGQEALSGLWAAPAPVTLLDTFPAGLALAQALLTPPDFTSGWFLIKTRRCCSSPGPSGMTTAHILRLWSSWLHSLTRGDESPSLPEKHQEKRAVIKSHCQDVPSQGSREVLVTRAMARAESSSGSGAVAFSPSKNSSSKRLTGTSFPNSQLEAALGACTSLSGKEQLKIASD